MTRPRLTPLAAARAKRARSRVVYAAQAAEWAAMKARGWKLVGGVWTAGRKAR